MYPPRYTMTLNPTSGINCIDNITNHQALDPYLDEEGQTCILPGIARLSILLVVRLSILLVVLITN